MWIWEHPAWPHMAWDTAQIEASAAEIECGLERLAMLGSMVTPQELLRRHGQSVLDELISSFAIEGEKLNRASVWSSISDNLGIPAQHKVIDHYADGLTAMYYEAMRNPYEITPGKILSWHKRLFPYNKNAFGDNITAGAWRDTPVRVISNMPKGDFHKNFIRYMAPPPQRIETEMAAFFQWLNGKKDICSAALAHLWFVSIHPFSDGNGRMARTISDAILARHDGCACRLYSISQGFLAKRNTYYRTLEMCTFIKDGASSALDVTVWLKYFCDVLLKQVKSSAGIIERSLIKTIFWDKYRGRLTARQAKVVNKLLNPRQPFAGKLDFKKYAALAKCGIDDAETDIARLKAMGALSEDGKCGGLKISVRLPL